MSLAEGVEKDVFLATDVLPKINLFESTGFCMTGMEVVEYEGSYFIHCPYCGSETYYFARTSTINCKVCEVVPISAIITGHYKSDLIIKLMAQEAGLNMSNNNYFKQKYKLSLTHINDFLHAQLTYNFKSGLRAGGWTEEEITNAILGTVSDEAANLWDKFIGYEYPEDYKIWSQFEGSLLMPFDDGASLNAIILPADFHQRTTWELVDFKFLSPPKFWRVWSQKARALPGDKIIAVSNPLYAVYLLAQNKPAIFVHQHTRECNISTRELSKIYVFEDDLLASKSFPSAVNIIEDEYDTPSQNIWEILKSIDINNNIHLDWKSKVSKDIDSGLAFLSAIASFERHHNVEVVVRPL